MIYFMTIKGNIENLLGIGIQKKMKHTIYFS